MHIPNSTYRIQFNSSFRFNDAKAIISYLAELGISDIYASPIFKARKGSMHGYDVVEPNQLNPELGTPEDFNELIEELKKHNMNWIQDIVPNHMAYNHENQMLIDLLENGSASRYYNFFDIEWTLYQGRSQEKVLAPFLGKFYQEALESGEIKLKYEEEGFSINYYEIKLPVKMESYGDIISFNFDKIKNRLGRNHPDVIKYLGVFYILKSLPSAEQLDERYDQIKFVKGMLWELYKNNKEVKVFVNETIKTFNGIPRIPESFNMLDNLLLKQHFRLAYWKVANEEVNYRRFFTISDLISLKMENEETFNRTHSLILKLIRENKISGLRIDHVDGLYDPSEYLSRLRERAKNIYLVVEKILEFDESLPLNWQIDGTTGYDFLNHVNGIFCSRENEKKLTSIYQRFTGFNSSYEVLIREKKKLIIETRMAGELERLAHFAEDISNKDRYGIDITHNGFKSALGEILAYFPVYRTYINKNYYSATDKKYISSVIEKLKEVNPRLINEFNYIGNLLLMKFGEHFTAEQKQGTIDFIMRFQQLTGPLMAKGFEDTVLYIYNRFISLNEVGGNPIKFGISLKNFHRFNRVRLLNWKHTLNSTSTHDTKRGEDVRARLNVLSELPDEWNDKIKLWSKLNNNFKKDNRYPDANDEYFLYQTLVGSYPFSEKEHSAYVKRIKEYVIKAVRGAKVYTAWIKPDEEYENVFTDFIDKILNHAQNNRFFKDFISFQKKIAYYGIFNSLSQTLIKITSPGVPDFYQGREMWDLFLVDPDNRRQVNFEKRKKALSKIIDSSNSNFKSSLSYYYKNITDGKIKLFLIYKALKVRKAFMELFNEGDYLPLDVSGDYNKNIIAFAREFNGNYCISIVPRFLTKLIKENEFPFGTKIWKDTFLTLPFNEGNLIDAFTEEHVNPDENKIPIGRILKNFPVSLLVSENNYKIGSRSNTKQKRKP